MKAGEGVLDAIRHFGSQGRIFYVHFRDVQGGIEDFTECFLGDGNCDPVETIRTLKDVGFRGFLIPDHVPQMEGDEGWNHRGTSLDGRLHPGIARRGGGVKRREPIREETGSR